MDTQKVAAFSKMKSPQTIKALRTISVLDIVQGSERIAEPLYKLLIGKERFYWSKECDSAVEQQKQALQKAPVLCYPNAMDPYTLTTDTSLFRIGAFVSQRQQ